MNAPRAGEPDRRQAPDSRRRAGPPVAETYPEEWPRLSSLCAREGEAAAADFCRRTMAIYRHALLAHRCGSPHASYATLPEYRSRFIRSYCEFKRFASRHAAV